MHKNFYDALALTPKVNAWNCDEGSSGMAINAWWSQAYSCKRHSCWTKWLIANDVPESVASALKSQSEMLDAVIDVLAPDFTLPVR